jgi:hypothetical protein
VNCHIDQLPSNGIGLTSGLSQISRHSVINKFALSRALRADAGPRRDSAGIADE